MIRTFDFLFDAWNQEAFMQKMQECLSNPQDGVLCTEGLVLTFNGAKKTMKVTSRNKDSEFACKVIPKVLTYRAVEQMLNKDFASLLPGDIRDI